MAQTLEQPIQKRGRGRPTGSLGRKTIQSNPPINAEEVSISVTSVFDRNYDSTNKTVLNRGGSGSSKSYSLAQLMIERFFSVPGRQILIARKTLPALKLSTIRMMRGILMDKYKIWNRIQENRQEGVWAYGKSNIYFSGIEDAQRFKSSSFHDIWLEEATEFTYFDYVQMKLQLRADPIGGLRNQLYMSFNPINEFHWIKTDLIDKAVEDFKEIHSTYKDNPFLHPDYIAEIVRLEQMDKNYFNIFGKGERGRLMALIFSNWVSVEDKEFNGNKIYGLDFGFTNSETALVEIVLDNREARCKELIYERGLTNPDLIKRLEELIIKEDRRKYQIYADSAEPDRIEEINRAGFWCIPAHKNVMDGIDSVKMMNLKITESSPNLLKEVRSYSWRTDKNGHPIDEPVKFADHLLDGCRYAIHTHTKEARRGKPRIRSFTLHDEERYQDNNF